MAQRQSSRQSNLRQPRARPGILEVTLEEVSDQATGERLHRAYEFILLIAEQAKQDRCTKATEMEGAVDDG
jgi:hypothetical protein